MANFYKFIGGLFWLAGIGLIGYRLQDSQSVYGDTFYITIALCIGLGSVIDLGARMLAALER